MNDATETRIRTLLDQIVENAIAELHLERHLAYELLTVGRETPDSERYPVLERLALYLFDRMTMHRDLQDANGHIVEPTFAKCTEYLAKRMQISDWVARRDALEDEFDAMEDEFDGIMEDFDTRLLSDPTNSKF